MCKRIGLFLILVLVGVLFSACSPQQIQPAETAMPTPTRTAKPSSTPTPTSIHDIQPAYTRGPTQTVDPAIVASQTAAIPAFQCQETNSYSRIPSTLLTVTPQAEDNRLIAFSNGRWPDSNYSEIYTVRLDGSDLKQVTTNSANDRAPTWSKDGKKILFYSNRNHKNCNGYDVCDFERFTINLDGTGSRRLTKELPEYPDDDISPDGKYRVYAREFYDEDRLKHLFMDYLSDIIIEPIRGSQEKNITGELQPGYFGYIRWSPTGQQFSFIGTTHQFAYIGKMYDSPGYWPEDVYIANTDGSGLQKLPGGPFWSSVSAAVWSPTGDRLAFLTKKGFAMMNADGSGFSEYVLGKLGGRELYWLNGGEELILMDIDDQYYKINADFTGLQKLPLFSGIDELLYRFELLNVQTLYYQSTYTYLSPNKKWIAYHVCNQLRVISTETHESYLVHTSSETDKAFEESALPIQTKAFGSIFWSPDSLKLIFAQNFRYEFIFQDYHGLFVVNLDGTGLHKLADEAWSPAIQP